MNKGGLLTEKENKINGWWINENPYVESYARSVEKSREHRNEFKVYYCNCCSRSYQIDSSYYAKGGHEVYYYKDFPTYKLKRKICIRCNNKQESK
tara:strand:- start:3130 stop:3414 length:285 start_codon:yes stop_codon:yes gene_type:complete